ncbi:MAG: Phenylalanine-tRNA ligase beta subunit [Candidatus Amesbacteria bacterium GW2011_GWB1_47_26]|uniref:phenylalanine--tRNA ligase n=1 Tax=Candidatus Amesbacteria bacterium GW2011_GWC2_45_19 TaxID=1618366 RepID=A0A0G1Q3D8_9BACT|nr:MAG: Phenylalanine-tRNA ligase beta subunit [Candidatus Amesbacteria bacterium GW2011_GWC2_45_19]KKU38644.1 MAG: Phenylalanine-tRNA ligase beta subunit [Candidatus Amesbacteria bacterium GW2011_GWA1_46_35]KKU74964.1 MAG: Phenylalanine-tRNA ligase beta subunit [Candidatus Amesbacteria bacterium GW2011_GWB1_47_26]KKU80263.1 MAG: Phenylalanine-tRNA ligase beta subunit [Candidatus Amesbacteria bacterium GW2011_GWA2_47_70]
MIVPLKWLSEYVKLPTRVSDLTDKLTSVGHMLDKTIANGIDLELRGNRPDMLGLVGVAREVAAIFNTRLQSPPTTPLPKTDKKSPLVNVDQSASDLVTRYTGFTLAVKVRPSPSWLVERLAAWGVPAINNVVDITNYVMIETGQPLHAFALDQLSGRRLILRRAKKGEKFHTIHQGQVLYLTSEDLVICDAEKPQALTMIGGLHSKVTDHTTEILLESAVYNQANCRRCARRLKITTDASTRHEKLLHPAQVIWALERAYYLLQELASAKSTSLVSDYYPQTPSQVVINFDPAEVVRLGGINIPPSEISGILARLEFQVALPKVTVPSFRTDIEQSADLVEEVLRLHGYDRIPSTPLSGAIPAPQTYPSYSIQEKLRRHLISLGLNEVITLPIISNRFATPASARLVNPPDPDAAVLRTSLMPGLSQYATRWLNFNQPRVAIFEIGKVFCKSKSKFSESLMLGIGVASLKVRLQDLTGVIQKLAALLGTALKPQITAQKNIFCAEINVDQLLPQLPRFTNPYSIISQFPPIIEDINVAYTGNYAAIVARIKKISSLINQIELIDKFENKLTLRLTYHDPKKQLSSTDIAPIRQKLESLI